VWDTEIGRVKGGLSVKGTELRAERVEIVKSAMCGKPNWETNRGPRGEEDLAKQS